MLRSGAKFKFSGRIHDDDIRHLAISDAGTVIAPSYVTVPGGRKVPQYAPTVVGSSTNYDPSGDCDGNFTSCKFQPNNNCYNYACNIATNSFAQPGRMHGVFLSGPMNAQDVVKGAVTDGLILLSGNSVAGLRDQVAGKTGHIVALLISATDSSVAWPGDYHWVRCDKLGPPASWSQKDGGDQVTNFDFAGNAIVDPAVANWNVNQGPMIANSTNDVIVSYSFHAYMLVSPGVSII